MLSQIEKENITQFMEHYEMTAVPYQRQLIRNNMFRYIELMIERHGGKLETTN